MKARFVMLAVIAGLLVALAAATCTATVWYVKEGSSGNGTSWNNAFGTVEEGLGAASAFDEVWVAAGTYQSVDPEYEVYPAVRLYGGFAGTETSRDDRDWATNETVLYSRWIYVGGDDPFTCVDGFTILAPKAIYLIENATISHCKIVGRYNSSYGDLINIEGPAKFVNNLVTDNSSSQSGTSVIKVWYGQDVRIVNNTIAGNSYDTAVFAADSDGVYLSNNIIVGGYDGIYGDAYVTLYNNCVYNMSGTAYDGVSHSSDINSDPLLTASKHLMPNSPCINAGLNSQIESAYIVSLCRDTDLDKATRIQDTYVDIGCYEY